jgi:hypothetical protein
MEVIRRALGQSKLNYLGYSYGTYLGTLYAGLFPRSVGRMVLDGADDPWGANFVPSSPDDPSESFGVSPSIDTTVAQAQSFEHDLTDFLKSCLTNSYTTVETLHCPFTSSVASAKRRVTELLSDAEKHPLVAKDHRKLGAFTLAAAIEEPLYDRTEWPKLTKLFVDLQHGNPARRMGLTTTTRMSPISRSDASRVGQLLTSRTTDARRRSYARSRRSSVSTLRTET